MDFYITAKRCEMRERGLGLMPAALDYEFGEFGEFLPAVVGLG